MKTIQLDHATAGTILAAYVTAHENFKRIDAQPYGPEWMPAMELDTRLAEIVVNAMSGTPVNVTESDLRSSDDDREAARQASFGAAVTAWELPADDTTDLAELVHNVS